MAITNSHYLLQKYSEERENVNGSIDNNTKIYWKGAMDTYRNLFSDSFDSTELDSETIKIKDLIFHRLWNYQEALDHVYSK